MTWPADIPVSYAPSHQLRQDESGRLDENGYMVFQYPLSRVKAPSRKIWLSDSPIPTRLNVSATRWREHSDINYNFPRQAFSRHADGGNALFFDGHVEWLPLSTFTEPANGSMDATIRLYFNPNREPTLDE